MSGEGPTAVTFSQSTQLDFTEINPGCRGGENRCHGISEAPIVQGKSADERLSSQCATHLYNMT